jgi:hypothetical protein
VYWTTIHNVLPLDSLILHHAKVSEILNWTKQHLDASLAMVEVVCEWNLILDSFYSPWVAVLYAL